MSSTIEHQPTFLLQILSDEDLHRRRFLLGVGSHVVGSGSDVDFHLPAEGVSRRHSVIEVLPGGGAVIEDLDSKNGTYVSGRRVSRAVAADGALLRFGVVEAQLVARSEVKDALAVEVGGGQASIAETADDADDRSTARVRAADRVMASACERLTGAGSHLSEILGRLAADWLQVIPAERVEFLRLDAGESPAVAASAGVPGEPPLEAPALRVEAHELAVEIWSASKSDLGTLRRPIELCLLALATEDPSLRTDDGGPRAIERDTGASPVLPSLNPAFRELYNRAAKVARGEIPVLIVGPSGSGKEVLAHFIHEHSARATGPFVAINCTALPGELLEVELFGIERGVATGVEARAGFIEKAEGGTLFLDEIGDMPAETQAKLLRVLEGQGFYRVGGRGLISVDVRIIAATNRPIEALVSDGSFRGDLYHRIASFVAGVPALSEHPEDIPTLAARFFAEEQEKNRTASPGITRAALAAMVDYRWPGNVRELKNEVARAALMIEGNEPLGLEHLSSALQGPEETGTSAPLSLAEAVAQAENRAFRVALAATDGDPGRARDLLGIGKTSYYAKLKQLRIGGQEDG
ncbi:MAG: sigma 54-interacting transcriptional regulator [Thermoanaerobaculales bacterium]|nr:sigma 54-interacting transcriptional regulator [Thermoanaerobaculales bacterium]